MIRDTRFQKNSGRKPKKVIENKTEKIPVKNTPEIELEKQTPTSIISVSRNYVLNLDFLDTKNLDILYATVPEISRTIDLRGAAIIYRGYEISARNDSNDAKKFANICSYILNKSGGVNFIEQWQKNADLYGKGFVEIVENEDSSKIEELAHVSPHNFGYELEVVEDKENFTKKSQIKLDKGTGKPVGYATYTYNEQDDVYENNKKIPKEKIAHLKYKVIGDALYGISLIQPMAKSIKAKLQIEDSTVSAANLVSAPKVVIKGNFDTEEDAREKAKEAASLDQNDVVLLDNGDEFSFVNPGEIRLPELREMFITNITTASGIPRPVLTSESSEINKATLQELMKELRENMRSNMGKIKHIMEHKIFKRIGQVYGIKNYERLLPVFSFPEDVTTEEEIITREEKKAATLTSLSNNLSILNNLLLNVSDESVKKELLETFKKTMQTYNQTIETFSVNNDQRQRQIEEELPEDIEEPTTELQLDYDSGEAEISFNEISEQMDNSIMSFVTLIDEIDEIKQPKILIDRHEEIHKIYDSVYNGAEMYDYNSGELITLPGVVKKHQQYKQLMKELGVIHELIEIGSDLDQIE